MGGLLNIVNRVASHFIRHIYIKIAGFLYQTNSDAVLFEWVVSDPDYREDDRKTAIELLIKEAENTCKDWGYKHMFTIGRTKSLIETHRKMGWHVDDNSSHEITKNL